MYNVEGHNEESCVWEFKTLRNYLRQERQSEYSDDITNELVKIDGRKGTGSAVRKKKEYLQLQRYDLWRAKMDHVIKGWSHIIEQCSTRFS